MDLIELLIENEADVNRQDDSYSQTALHIAIYNGNCNIQINSQIILK